MNIPEAAPTNKKQESLSIWFFCGLLTFVYGLILVGQGIYDLYHPPMTVLAELHPTLKWGVLMAVIGAVYVVRFRPVKG